jgi:catechol 2,3-dioxygenase-like lactoylglutathione lyase family enzyme
LPRNLRISENITSIPVFALFKKFESNILDKTVPIHEEILEGESLSQASKLHHIEIYCSSLEKSAQFWSWFLGEIGYKQFQKWPGGISFKLGSTYIVFVQAETKHLDFGFHRCRPGLNHLAFHAPSKQCVDTMTSKMKERGIKILYSEKHPHAGGTDSYGVFFEDPERLKVELMVSPTE